MSLSKFSILCLMVTAGCAPSRENDLSAELKRCWGINLDNKRYVKKALANPIGLAIPSEDCRYSIFIVGRETENIDVSKMLQRPGHTDMNGVIISFVPTKILGSAKLEVRDFRYESDLDTADEKKLEHLVAGQ